MEAQNKKVIFEVFDSRVYFKNVITYSHDYLKVLKHHFKLDISLNDTLVKIKDALFFLRDNPIIVLDGYYTTSSRNRKKLKRILELDGLDIVKIYNKGFYDYFLPQNQALCMIFCLLTNKINESLVKKPRNLSSICNLFGLSKYKIALLKSCIRVPLQKRWVVMSAVFDPSRYFNEVITCCQDYLKAFKRHFKLDISLEDTIVKIKDALFFLRDNPIVVLNNYYTTSSRNLREIKRILERDGLDIVKIYNKGFYDYFLPQNQALCMVYFLLINRIKLGEIKPKNLSSICNLFRLSNYKVDLLKSYLKVSIQKHWDIILHGFRYTNAIFKERLTRLSKEVNRLDIMMVLKLFDILNLDFRIFVERVLIINYKSDASNLIKKLEEHDFSYIRYLKIRNNIKDLRSENRITDAQCKQGVDLITKIITKISKIRGKDLRHNSLQYRFKYNEGNISRIGDSDLRGKLLNFMENIMNNNYPLALFNKKDNPIRSSKFYLEGNRREPIYTKIIKK